jgi:cytochrome c oxidase subunit 2
MQRDEADDPSDAATRRPVRTALWLILGAIGVAIPTMLVARSSATFGAPASATSDGEHVLTAWRILMTIATAVASIVLILLGIALVSGARRKVPSRSKGNVPLEVTYTAVPLALVGLIFGLSLWLQHSRDESTKGESLDIGVDAFRWGWRFTYPDGREVITDNDAERAQVLLPIDTNVRFTLHSEDVIHSFFVPSFITKQDVIPGDDKRLVVHTDRLGVYDGHCAEYCGIDHARMNFVVGVVTEDAFDAWLAGAR